jgi:hypothetical protein
MANNNGSSSSQNMPMFNGVNYHFWRIKMKTLFLSYDLWDLVENGFDDPLEITAARQNDLKDKQKMDVKALFMIQQALDDAIFPKLWVRLPQNKFGIYLKINTDRLRTG